MLECGFPFGVCQFCKNVGLNYLFLIIVVPIFLWARIIYWVGNFGQWAGWIYWAGGQMPTQLTCYLLSTSLSMGIGAGSFNTQPPKPHFHSIMTIHAVFRSRGVASLIVPGGQELYFPHFSSNFHHFFLFFLKFSLLLSSFWCSRWATCPSRKALATPLFRRDFIVWCWGGGRHTGMCHSDESLFHTKSLNNGPFFYKNTTVPVSLNTGPIFSRISGVCMANTQKLWKMGLYFKKNPITFPLSSFPSPSFSFPRLGVI